MFFWGPISSAVVIFEWVGGIYFNLSLKRPYFHFGRGFWILNFRMDGYVWFILFIFLMEIFSCP